MDGIHDMGGMHGFGPIVREENEPIYSTIRWESRVLAIAVATPGPRPRRITQQYREHGPGALPVVQLLRKMALFPDQRPHRRRGADTRRSWRRGWRSLRTAPQRRKRRRSSQPRCRQGEIRAFASVRLQPRAEQAGHPAAVCQGRPRTSRAICILHRSHPPSPIRAGQVLATVAAFYGIHNLQDSRTCPAGCGHSPATPVCRPLSKPAALWGESLPNQKAPSIWICGRAIWNRRNVNSRLQRDSTPMNNASAKPVQTEIGPRPADPCT